MTPTEPSAPLPAVWVTAVLRALRAAKAAALTPVDGAWLAVFRALFGSLLAISMLRFLYYGWVDHFFVQPRFFFKYWGFQWVPLLPAPYIHALFVVLVLLALCTAAGAAYRLAATGLALGLSYIQLLDVSTYLNHYYLAALLAWLLAFAPAHGLWSVDSWLRARRGLAPLPQVRCAWLYLFRFQVGLVYTFAGLAKAQSDWLIHAQPLRIWLGANTELPIIGPVFTWDGVPLLMSWCGFLFDSSIVIWLSLRRTRLWAYAVVLVFHALTRVLFPIGMFPAIMALGALAFFEPDWPRVLFRRVRSWFSARSATTRLQVSPQPAAAPGLSAPLPLAQRVGWAAALVYCGAQLVLPLRFLAYDGNVLWHEQGMRFSWRVMVRAKGGSTTFWVTDQAGKTWAVDPGEYLTGLQESEMSSQPDLIAQLARHIRADLAARGHGEVAVRAQTLTSLNGRRSIPMIDPTVNLAAQRDGLQTFAFVLPAPTQVPPHTRPVL